MTIGNGDIAGVLNDREGFIFFASGVSNSGEKRESEYEREVDLLLEQDKNKHLVYFGSLCVFYSDTRYSRHKRTMEELVKTRFPHYTIMRLGNITWGNNPNTLINNMKHKIRNHQKLEIQDTYRYIVSLKELQHWLSLIPEWNCEMNITGRLMKVQEVLEEYVYG